jgi:hypothetical protein
MYTLGDKNQPEFSQKSAFKYFCKYCDYGTSKKCNYDTHNTSRRHSNAIVDYTKHLNSAKIQPVVKNSDFICECGKKYISRQSLWRHKKSCNNLNINSELEVDTTVNDGNNDKNDKLIEYLLKENKEIKELILEIVKNGTNNNSHNTTHTNSHNKAFNLNFFLNETCKNAMNITDFVDSIKLQLSDFMNVGDVGFVEGISNIIVKKLNSLDETVRPIHCTDQKRETFYMKDENIWEKDDDDNKRLKKMISSITYKNERLMNTYKEVYPDYNDPTSYRSDQYSKIMVEAMDCKEDSRDKIIKNISKATTISKNKA